MAEEQKPTKSELLSVFYEMFRSVTRPAVTIIFAGVIAQVVTDGIPVPEWFIGLASSVIGFWFIDRGVHRWKNNGGS